MENISMGTELLTIDEAAEWLGYSPDMIGELMLTGLLPSVEFEEEIRFIPMLGVISFAKDLCARERN